MCVCVGCVAGERVITRVRCLQFQYNRVLQYVNACSELVLRPAAKADSASKARQSGMATTGSCEDLRQSTVAAAATGSRPLRTSISSGTPAVAAGSAGKPTEAALTGGALAASVASAPVPTAMADGTPTTAAAEPTADASANVTVYMDAHLARHLVQYVQLLQRIFISKSKTMAAA